MAETTDPVVSGLRELGDRIEAATRALHEMVVSSRVKKYTFNDLKDLTAYYVATYLDNIGLSPALTPRTWASAKAILKLMPLADAKLTIDSAFEDTFFCENIRELWSIANNLNKYRRVAPTPPPPLVDTQYKAPWDDTRILPVEDNELKSDLQDLNAKLGL